jgi:integrase
MSITTSPPLPSPFNDPAAPTLATVIRQLETAEPDPRRRGEMISAIRTVCRVVRFEPHELPADLLLLNRRMRKAMIAAVGVSQSRWSNARSLLLRALKQTGLSIMPGRRLHPLSPAWAALDALLPQRFMRAGLSRFMRWCSALSIEPADLTLADFARFRAAVLNDSLLENGWNICQSTVRLWNQAVSTIPGWPQLSLPVTPARERYALPLEAFPASFQADVQDWLDQLSGKGGLLKGPLRPVRPATLEKWQFAIRQLASGLVKSGRDPASITSLADLVTPEAADLILSFHLERNGGKPSALTQSLAANLKALARHHVGVSGDDLADLKRMARMVTPKQEGMTGKNRETLRQFDDPRQQQRLVSLPARLFADLPAAEDPLPFRLAVRLQSALAVAILLSAPMRLQNLRTLEIGRTLLQVGTGRRAGWRISIPGDEVKNEEAIELPLPERTGALVDLYRKRVLPVLAPGGTRFLFPGKNGPKADVSLGSQVPAFVARELGLRLTVHQFRHLVGYIYLQRHPHGHEVVRRMLGHKDIRTTIRFYAGMEGAAAARSYEEVMQDLLGPTSTRRRGQKDDHARGWL